MQGACIIKVGLIGS